MTINHTDVSATDVTVSGLSIVLARSVSTPVVQDVSFTVREGEVMGLVGESGSGKTTIGLALLGHARTGLRIASGSVNVGTTDILKLKPRELRRERGRLVAYVPQDPASAMNPTLTVGRQLEEIFEARGTGLTRSARRARCMELLSEVNLDPSPNLLKRYPHQFSGGQIQRVGIAMAFASQPRLIVLDEPTTGLDVSTQRHILDMVRRLCADYGCSAVYVSHDLPVVADISHTVSVLYAGRVIESGSTVDVFRHPRHPYTKGLLRAAPSTERALPLVGIEGAAPRPGEWPPGCAFAGRCELVSDECRAALPDLATVASVQVRCIKPDAPEARAVVPPLAAPVQAEDYVLEVGGLTASYGGRRVLHGLDFKVGRGGTLAIVGESGSGKTTLAKCLIGLHKDWAGTALFNGQQLAHVPRVRSVEQRRAVQYCFQNPYNSLNPKQTVREILEAPLREFGTPRGERADLIESTLADVALLPSYRVKYPNELSGGERQRVALARSLIVMPELIICDEVTSALDVSVQASVVESLRRVQRERGLSLLFITHNMGVVRSIARDVIVLQKGRIVELGATSTVLDAPTDNYTQELLRDVPRLEMAGQARE